MAVIRRRDVPASRPSRVRLFARGACIFVFGNLLLLLVLDLFSQDENPSEASSGLAVLPTTHSEQLTSRRAQSTDSVVQDNDSNLEPIPRPPLSSIVQGWNITGDPSWLLQFSIVGFPKSGTSTLMHHLREHPEIHIFKDERCELAYNQQVILIEDMYRQFPPATEKQRFVRGIKCPLDLENPKLSMTNYRKFFPKTDFIVGIRHPVLWYVRKPASAFVCATSDLNDATLLQKIMSSFLPVDIVQIKYKNQV